jgi:hypothetical protein
MAGPSDDDAMGAPPERARQSSSAAMAGDERGSDRWSFFFSFLDAGWLLNDLRGSSRGACAKCVRA